MLLELQKNWLMYWFKVVWPEYYKNGNYIVVFMNLYSLNDKVKNNVWFCEYGVDDILHIVETVFRMVGKASY